MVLRQIVDDLTFLVDFGESVEDQCDQVTVDLVELTQDRIDVLGDADQALHVGPSPVGDDNGSEAERQVNDQDHQQNDANENQEGLPANVRSHVT